jgi:hypothetical protein
MKMPLNQGPVNSTVCNPNQNKRKRKRQSRDRPNLAAIARKLLEKRVPIRVGDRIRRVPRMEALVRVHMAKAINGDPNSLAMIGALIQKTGLQDVISAPPVKHCLVISGYPMTEEEWSYWMETKYPTGHNPGV